MPQIIWTRYFLEAQGYGVNDNIVYQDNKSAILLEKHGRVSSSKRTRHINIRYFFVKDRIESGEVSVEYCPTEHMLADYFTKPLQGSQFKIFRNRIMNYNPDEESNLNYRSVLEEAEAEVRTDDEWTLVQCKHKFPKVGLGLRSKGVHDDKVNDVREQNLIHEGEQKC